MVQGCIAVALILLGLRSHESPNAAQGQIWDFLHDLLRTCLKLSTWWITLKLATFPIEFACICYRFDCSESLGGTQEEAIGVLEASAMRDRLATTFSAKRSFKPYFVMSIMTWCLANLLLGRTFAYLPIRHSIYLDQKSTFAIISSLASLPAMLVGVFVLGVVRKHAGRLWKYREDWGADMLPDEGTEPDSEVSKDRPERPKRLMECNVYIPYLKCRLTF